MTLGVPDSPGVTEAVASQTLVAEYNNLAEVDARFTAQGDEIAAVILEPVVGNMGVVRPEPGFLEGLREITARHGTVLIFDEVMTGFRVAWGGVQVMHDIRPDLTCLGKVIGGGLPLAAVGGRGEIMQWLAPVGPVYQAGTLSGNPLAVAAGLATLEELRSPAAYDRLESAGARMEAGLRASLLRHGVRGCVNRAGSMWTLFFGVEQVRAAADAQQCDRERFARFFHSMLEHGVYLPPSAFEAAFLSLAHSDGDIDRTLQGADRAICESAP
jgi:glutamate-1-semialdehyde 2,1-aminomutase